MNTAALMTELTLQDYPRHPRCGVLLPCSKLGELKGDSHNFAFVADALFWPGRLLRPNLRQCYLQAQGLGSQQSWQLSRDDLSREARQPNAPREEPHARHEPCYHAHKLKQQMLAKQACGRRPRVSSSASGPVQAIPAYPMEPFRKVKGQWVTNSAV